jgi:hypothetical protein
MMPLTKDDYRKAILAQDAVNASGLVHSLSEVMSRIRDEPDCTGTDFVNTHPIVRMYLNKLISLCGGADTLDFSEAYATCKKKANPKCDCGAQEGEHAPDCVVR